MQNCKKTQKKQKLDYWTENLKIMNPIFFLIKWFSICIFECLQPNHEIVSTLFYRYKTKVETISGFGSAFQSVVPGVLSKVMEL